MVWLQRLMMTTLLLLPVLKVMTICGFVHNELNQTQYELLCDATRSLLIVIASRLHATSGHAGGFMKLKQKKLMLTPTINPLMSLTKMRLIFTDQQCWAFAIVQMLCTKRARHQLLAPLARISASL
jgi:hypothetical protein